MKTKARSIPVAICLSALAGGALLYGCSSSSPPDAPPADTGTPPADTTPKDTGKPAADTGDLLCDLPLDSTFTCAAPTKVAGGTTCNDASVLGFVQACWTVAGGDTAKCAAWQGNAANAACNTCITRWTKNNSFDRDACYYQILDSTCAGHVKCYFDCVEQVCADCFATGVKKDSDDCQARARAVGRPTAKPPVPPGACYTNSYKDANAGNCFASSKIGVCIISQPPATNDVIKADVLRVYTGACRDNADWTNASTPKDSGPG